MLYITSQVVEITEYRSELYEYLKNRMMAIAPNLTLMVGELVGARLIAHAGEQAHWVIKSGLLSNSYSTVARDLSLKTIPRPRIYC